MFWFSFRKPSQTEPPCRLSPLHISIASASAFCPTCSPPSSSSSALSLSFARAMMQGKPPLRLCENPCARECAPAGPLHGFELPQRGFAPKTSSIQPSPQAGLLLGAGRKPCVPSMFRGGLTSVLHGLSGSHSSVLSAEFPLATFREVF